jgi:hypothetical protein
MGTMKYGANAVESQTNPRTIPLRDLASQRFQKGFDISPYDIG